MRHLWRRCWSKGVGAYKYCNYHEEAEKIHVTKAGACAAQKLIFLKRLPEWLQLLTERLDIGLPLAELQ